MKFDTNSHKMIVKDKEIASMIPLLFNIDISLFLFIVLKKRGEI